MEKQDIVAYRPGIWTVYIYWSPEDFKESFNLHLLGDYSNTDIAYSKNETLEIHVKTQARALTREYIQIIRRQLKCKRVTIHGAWDISSSAFEEDYGWRNNWLHSITLKEGLRTISDKAFNNCVSLSTITIPASVETIGDMAFMNCTNLHTISFSTDEEEKHRLQSIGDNAFKGCTALSPIHLPDSSSAKMPSHETPFTSTSSVYIDRK